jgi:hypothetical protein
MSWGSQSAWDRALTGTECRRSSLDMRALPVLTCAPPQRVRSRGSGAFAASRRTGVNGPAGSQCKAHAESATRWFAAITIMKRLRSRKDQRQASGTKSLKAHSLVPGPPVTGEPCAAFLTTGYEKRIIVTAVVVSVPTRTAMRISAIHRCCEWRTLPSNSVTVRKTRLRLDPVASIRRVICMPCLQPRRDLRAAEIASMVIGAPRKKVSCVP